MFRQQQQSQHPVGTTSPLLPRVPFLEAETVSDTSSTDLPEAVMHRVEDYLDRVLAPLTAGAALPYARRQELRRELHQHLDAMIRAYQELGETPETACEKAFAQFGTPEEVAASIRRTGQSRWSRIRIWWKQPRLSAAAGVLNVLLIAGIAGMTGAGYLNNARLSGKTEVAAAATQKVQPAQGGVMLVPLRHTAFLGQPCTACHSDQYQLTRYVLVQSGSNSPRMLRLSPAPSPVVYWNFVNPSAKAR